MKYKAHRDFTKFQPSGFRFGQYDDPDAFLIEGDNAKDAMEKWNADQLPGNRKNAWYFRFEEVKESEKR